MDLQFHRAGSICKLKEMRNKLNVKSHSYRAAGSLVYGYSMENAIKTSTRVLKRGRGGKAHSKRRTKGAPHNAVQ